MPGDVIPFESEVLVLSAMTGWPPDVIEGLSYDYYANLSAAWGMVQKKLAGKGKGGKG